MVEKIHASATRTASEVEQVARSGNLPYNVHQSVRTEPLPYGGFSTYLKSLRGEIENTGVRVNSIPDLLSGCTNLVVVNDGESPEYKAKEIETSLVDYVTRVLRKCP